MLTKFAELMWSGKGKLRRGEGCPRYNISSTLPQVVPRTQELTGSAVERCRVASLYLMWTKRGRGATGPGFGFTYLFKYAGRGGCLWGEHLAESRWVTLHNPQSHLSDSL